MCDFVLSYVGISQRKFGFASAGKSPFTSFGDKLTLKFNQKINAVKFYLDTARNSRTDMLS